MKNNTNITYRPVGDFLIPNLTLPPEETNIKLGKWGMLHKEYLKKHKPIVFAILITQGKLWPYLADVDTQASYMYNNIIEQIKEKEEVTEQLKSENQMQWVCHMENIEARARDVVNIKLINI